MNKLVLFLVSVLLFSSCKEEKKYNLIVKTNSSENRQLYLEQLTDKGIIALDTAIQNKGAFSFKYKTEELGVFQIRDKMNNKVILFLDKNSTPTLSCNNIDSLPYAQNNDSLSSNLNILNNLLAEQNRLENEINLEYKKAKEEYRDELVFKQLNTRYTLSKIKFKKSLKSFINEYESDLSSLIAISYFTINEEVELYNRTLNSLIAKYGDQIPYLTNIKEQFDAETFLVGQVLNNITLSDIDGNTKELYQIKDSLIIVELWTSWASKYIQGIHEHKRLTSPFLDKGLSIFSINLDTEKELWDNTRLKLNIPGIHVNDSLGFELSSLVKEYQIQQLPFNLILNSQYQVIAKNLWGEPLEDFIIENL